MARAKPSSAFDAVTRSACRFTSVLALSIATDRPALRDEGAVDIGDGDYERNYRHGDTLTAGPAAE
jgi:hypothetical protein